MNRGADVAIIAKKLKERALAYPWVPSGIPPREHYHSFPDGLTICFTLDVLPATRYWHLSIARLAVHPTQEEVELWRHAFFDEEPTIELPGHMLGASIRHFYWRVE